MRRHRHADHERFARGKIGVDRRCTQLAAGAGVARRKLRRHLLFAHGFEFFSGAEAAVRGSIGKQQVAVLAVDFCALRLAIGAVGAAEVGAFIPGEAEPAKRVEDLLLGASDEAGAVRIFDAQDKFSAPLARIDVVDQANVGGTDVGVARGTGSNADAYGGFGNIRNCCHKGQVLMLADR